VFDIIYVGVAADFGAGVLAYFIGGRVVGWTTTKA
jgi:hypothetical protein